MRANQPDICTPYPRPVPEDPQLFLSPHRPIEPPAPRSLCYQRKVWVAVLSGCHCRLGPRQVPDYHFPTFLLGRWLTCAPFRTVLRCTKDSRRMSEFSLRSTATFTCGGSNRPRTCVQVSESTNPIHKCNQKKRQLAVAGCWYPIADESS